jgi:hypothetical protein
MPTAPTLPPVSGVQNAGIHSATGGPALTDLGIAAQFAGCIITSLKTAFPLTQDTYHDEFMHPKVDVVYGQGMEITFDVEIHLRGQGAIGATDPGIPAMQIGSMIDGDTVQILTPNDTRGFGTGTGTAPGTLWPNGTKFIVTEGPGTFERQKLRKDSVKLVYRRYATS